MKKFMRSVLAVMLILSMVLVMASCGAAEEKKTETAENATATEEKKPTVVVGYTDYAPMNYTENGKLVGFDTELAEAVFAKLGYTPIFREINWDNKYSDLNAGSINCIWNGFTANTSDDDGVARADKVDFSYNYMTNEQVIVAKADFAATVTDIASLAGKVGAVENSSAGDTYLTTKLTGTIKKGVTAQMDALKDLALGTVDFAVLDAQLAKANIGKGDYTGLAIVETIKSEGEYYAIGFKKGSDLTAKVNGALEALAADGTISTIAAKYNLTNTAVTDFADQK
ncbi:MAG: transporter substrate-binding domain-containing protein [Clostridia bacterium]|nr:transporter substrate-binding domain-containing protein [Clostridia bacterium]